MFTAPCAPITAICAVGQAKLRSAPRGLEPMTSYAPPAALRAITVTFGTVASAYAYRSLAPRRMIPFHSWWEPGSNPGTYTSVRTGRLNESQVRADRAG